MPDSKISNLTELAESPDSVDELVIVDKSDTTMAASGTTKKITKANLVPQITPASSSAPASLDLHEDTDNGTNKITVTAPSAIASDKVLTLPDATDTLVGKATTDTLTNKTLTSPVIQDWDGWQVANETWTYASADDPTFTFTISGDKTGKYSPGMRIKLTQTTVKYFIITAVSYSSPNTTVTVYGGTDYDLSNETITAPYYSTQKAPLGFPLNPNKWTIASGTISVSQASPTANQYYNKATYAVPIGAWRIYLEGSLYGERDTSGVNEMWAGLGTANNNVNLLKLIFSTWVITGGGSITASKEFYVELSSKTNYYLNIGCGQAGIGTIAFGNVSSGYFRAICAYL